jgi:hypothetical protein
MYRCEVLTPWSQVGNRNEMAVVLDYPASWTDVTGQINILPDPNLLVAYGELSGAQLETLLADNAYAVLWYEEIT